MISAMRLAWTVKRSENFASPLIASNSDWMLANAFWVSHCRPQNHFKAAPASWREPCMNRKGISYKANTSKWLTNLFHQIYGAVGKEEDSDYEKHREDRRRPTQCNPIDECSNNVDKEDSDRQEELEKSAQRTTKRHLSNLGDEHWCDDTTSSCANTSEDSSSIKHSDTRSKGKCHPAD